MTTIRPTAVAGTFYPSDSAELSEMLRTYLNDSKDLGGTPKALIVPHAGYIYSGPIAASAYKQIESIKEKIRKVVLIGPSHRVPFQGLAVSSADFFESPLGDVSVDKSGIAIIAGLHQVHELDEAHWLEHSLEVQIPFLQMVLGDFSLIPIVVGDASTSDVAEVISELWGGEETLIVISSDLSHYLPYEKAILIDGKTSSSIESLDFNSLDHHQACGRNGINGLLKVAREKKLRVDAIDVRNSGDTAGDKDQVVGYGAYVCK